MDYPNSFGKHLKYIMQTIYENLPKGKFLVFANKYEFLQSHTEKYSPCSLILLLSLEGLWDKLRSEERGKEVGGSPLACITMKRNINKNNDLLSSPCDFSSIF